MSKMKMWNRIAVAVTTLLLVGRAGAQMVAVPVGHISLPEGAPVLVDARAGESRYETILRVYASGSLPQRKALLGWFRGLCYRPEAESPGIPSLFVGYPTPEVDEGPLFPAARPALKLVTLGMTNDADIVSSYARAVHLAVERNGAIVSKSHANITTSARTNRGYIVTRFGNENREEYMCYFWDKVGPGN